ncbi:MAG: 16S rRNA (adenine1518-N6/adenine1519-N6)-dimethyltransferase, partial [Oceanicoccus sp.]
MVKAKKSLGQNFLQDEKILAKIIEAADLSPDDHVLEIGPGKGALTDKLIEGAGKITAVELDDRLIPFLKL